MTELYAQALWNLSQKKDADAKVLVAHLVKNLQQSGRLKLLPQILVALKKIEVQHGKTDSVVEVANEHESKHALHEAGLKGIYADHAVVNHSLISGWRAIGKVEGKEKLIDASSKRALLEIYQAVTR
jgi:F0F1-type ATP synthase delta subunit